MTDPQTSPAVLSAQEIDQCIGDIRRWGHRETARRLLTFHDDMWRHKRRAEAAESALEKMREALRPVCAIVDPTRGQNIVLAHFTYDEWDKLRAAALSPASSSTGGENG